jgi:hypothetical protein
MKPIVHIKAKDFNSQYPTYFKDNKDLNKKKLKVKPVSYYSKRADTLLQELGRLKFKSCLVCGAPISCLHHYYTKSSSGNLRYNWLNLIPICQSCHFKHHNGNPDIQNRINEIKGKDWLVELQEAKKIPNPICNSKRYYEQVAEDLKREIENFK